VVAGRTAEGDAAYAVTGDTVNIARLQSAAEPGQVLVSATTLARHALLEPVEGSR
jgi:class 3 adenylate cyclase